MLNSTLTDVRDLPVSVDGGLKQPKCLYFDGPNGRLFVGESSGKRVLVFDNVFITAASFA
jgi:hypothetical protein